MTRLAPVTRFARPGSSSSPRGRRSTCARSPKLVEWSRKNPGKLNVSDHGARQPRDPTAQLFKQARRHRLRDDPPQRRRARGGAVLGDHADVLVETVSSAGRTSRPRQAPLRSRSPARRAAPSARCADLEGAEDRRRDQRLDRDGRAERPPADIIARVERGREGAAEPGDQESRRPERGAVVTGRGLRWRVERGGGDVEPRSRRWMKAE